MILGGTSLITYNGGEGWCRPISGSFKIGIAGAENPAVLILYNIVRSRSGGGTALFFCAKSIRCRHRDSAQTCLKSSHKPDCFCLILTTQSQL
jgi:hypothetical protein